MRLQQGDRQWLCDVLWHHFHQRAGLQLGLYVVARNLQKTQPRHTARNRCLGAVHTHPAGHRQRAKLAAVLPLPRFHPCRGRRRVVHRAVLRQVGRMLRHAVFAQVGRRRNVGKIQLAQRARHQAGIAQLADPQHRIATVFDQVHRAVGHAQVHFHLRILREEPGQRRCDDAAADAAGYVDLQQARRLGVDLEEQRFGVFDLGDQAQAARMEHVAVVGGGHPAGRALQQAGAEPLLQLRNGCRDRGTGQAQLVGGAREAGALHHPGEDAEAIDPVHCSLALES